MPPRNALIVVVTALVSLICHLKAERSRYSTQIGEAMHLIEDLYLEDVRPRELFENAMNGMTSGLDQYSQYIGPSDFLRMEQLLDQEFGGVGIEVEKESEQDPIIILSPLVGSPAYKSGLRAGDAIVAIDGVSTIGLKQQDCIPKMRGSPGSTVRLRIRRATSEQELEVAIIREIIQIDSLLGDRRHPDGSWDFHLAVQPRVGLLRLTTFGQHSAAELRMAVGGESPRFDALILDLRNNAGGLLDAAVETCDLFLDHGTIVTTRGRDRRERSHYEATSTVAVPHDIPLVILVNKYSASASEIVAACLQDHGRAVVIGERTWGKGTVQNLLRLEGGRSALKLTTASYWRPSGVNIHRGKDVPEDQDWGVRPNPGFEIALTDQEMEQVLIARRDRDLGRDGAADGSAAAVSPPAAVSPRPAVTPGTADRPSANGPTSATSAPPVEDRQLNKALEYLGSLLPKRPAS